LIKYSIEGILTGKKTKIEDSDGENILKIFLRSILDYAAGCTDNHILERYSALRDAEKNVW
jgi:dGTP triphosphohydrolase